MEIIQLPKEWVGSEQEWLNQKQSKIIYSSYILDGGSVVIYMASSTGKRWDLILSSPGNPENITNVFLKISSDASIEIIPESFNEKFLVDELGNAERGNMVTSNAHSTIIDWILKRHRNQDISAIQRTDVLTQVRE